MTTEQTRPGPAGPVGEKRDGLLRLALKLDAVASGALGALSLAGCAVLDGLLGIPIALLVPAGMFLVAYAASVWAVGTRLRISTTAAWAVVAVNLVWAADSVALVLAGWLPLTTFGFAFVLTQAAAVFLFADLQLLGLRRGRRAGRTEAA
jgi:hypothetical protein